MSAFLQVLRLDRNVDNLANTAGGGPLAMGARAQAPPTPAAASNDGQCPPSIPVYNHNTNKDCCARRTITTIWHGEVRWRLEQY